MTFLMIIYADDTTLYSNYDQTCDLWQLKLHSEVDSDLQDPVD